MSSKQNIEEMATMNQEESVENESNTAENGGENRNNVIILLFYKYNHKSKLCHSNNNKQLQKLNSILIFFLFFPVSY